MQTDPLPHDAWSRLKRWAWNAINRLPARYEHVDPSNLRILHPL